MINNAFFSKKKIVINNAWYYLYILFPFLVINLHVNDDKENILKTITQQNIPIPLVSCCSTPRKLIIIINK